MLTHRTSLASLPRRPSDENQTLDPKHPEIAYHASRKLPSSATLSNPLYDTHSDCPEPPSLATDGNASTANGFGECDFRCMPTPANEGAQATGTRFGGGHWSSRNRAVAKIRRSATAVTTASVRNQYATEEEAVFIQNSDGDYLKDERESWSYGEEEEAADNDEDEAVALLGSGSDAIPRAKRRGRGARMGFNWKVLVGLIFLAAVVRLFRISQPTSVVFDEVHFGGFASKYIRGAFFMDVHPPLGKLLIASAGKFAGFKGDFDFKEIGKDYLGSQVPYVPMRLLPALMGLLLVPVGYLTVRRSGCSKPASVLAATALLFENGLTTQSRHILLDAPLILFIALAPLMWTNFSRCKRQPFSMRWRFWLAMTGICLGLAVSVKWVGLFVIAQIGLSTLKDLWDLLGDVRIQPRTLIRHFVARAFYLIVVPIIIYMALFQVHFLSLPNSGTGDGFMSVEFQQTLKGAHSPSPLADIAYGSKVFLRHVATNGGYLHSHSHNYKTGSKQQQMTLYPHRDNNSYFVILKKHGETMSSTEIEWVKDGDIIRLQHVNTKRNLHSHDHRPPVTDNKNHNEVSGYGSTAFGGDSNDHWRVEIIESDPSDLESGKRLRAIRSKFRLKHVNTHCSLFSHSVKLPEYAFAQQEVTCMKNAKKAKTTWRIEENRNEKLPKDAEVVHYVKPGFFGKFVELHRVMWKTNQGLIDSHPFDSKPSTWPFLLRGISFWTKESKQVYLLGNPVVWWFTTASIGVFIIAEVTIMLRRQRGYKDATVALVRRQYESTMAFFFSGWLLHYAPFFLMGRQLFLHHYFPALYFGILLFATVCDAVTTRLSKTARWTFVAALSALFLWTFLRFSFVTYGVAASRETCEHARWLQSWDFDCKALRRDADLAAKTASPEQHGPLSSMSINDSA